MNLTQKPSCAVDEEQYTSAYWYQVGLVLEQAAGLEDGYHGRTNASPHRNVSVFGLYLIGTSGDVEGNLLVRCNHQVNQLYPDLEVILGKPSDLKRMLGAGKCSALVKGKN